jgi:hypothetical protein
MYIPGLSTSADISKRLNKRKGGSSSGGRSSGEIGFSRAKECIAWMLKKSSKLQAVAKEAGQSIQYMCTLHCAIHEVRSFVQRARADFSLKAAVANQAKATRVQKNHQLISQEVLLLIEPWKAEQQREGIVA